MGVVAHRFDVCLVNLDPTVGSEIQKTRPCLVVSPDEMNRALNTIIVAQMTTKSRPYPTRFACEFGGREGLVVLDQIRTIDRARLVRRLGAVDLQTQTAVLETLARLFAE